METSLIWAFVIHLVVLAGLLKFSKSLQQRSGLPVRLSAWSIAVSSAGAVLILPYVRDWLSAAFAVHPVWAPARVLPLLLVAWFVLAALVHTAFLLVRRPGWRPAAFSAAIVFVLAAVAVIPYALASDLSFHARLKWAPLDRVVGGIEPTSVYFIASSGRVERVQLPDLARESLTINGRSTFRSALRAVASEDGEGLVVQFSTNPFNRRKETVDGRAWGEAGVFADNEDFFSNVPTPARVGSGDKPTTLKPGSMRDRTLHGEHRGEPFHFAFKAPFYSARWAEDGSWLWTTSQSTIVDDRWVVTCLSGRWIIALDLDHRLVAVVGEGRSPVVVREAR
jgi:hypothetical protein